MTKGIILMLQTPPRVISLDDHYIPAADEMNEHNDFVEVKSANAVGSNNRARPFTTEDGHFKSSLR